MPHYTIMTWIDLDPRKLGTLEEYCLFLSDELKSRGHSSVLAFSKLPPVWLMEKFQSAGAEVVHVRPGSLFSTAWQLITLIRRYKVDILHGTFIEIFTPLNLILGVLSLRTRIVYSDQLSRFPGSLKRSRQWIRYAKNRLFGIWIDLIIADSLYLKRSLIVEYGASAEKIILLYNGVNLARFNPDQTGESIRKEFNLPDGGFVITTIASAIPEKGVDVYLRAAQQILQHHPKSVFLVVGDGPLLNDLKRLVADLCISDHVIFMGLRNDTQEILGATDIAVLCSKWGEAFSFFMLEALASGKPLIASNLGAIPEAVDHGTTGFLVPPGDHRSLAEALEKLLSDQGLRRSMGASARDKCVKQYDLREMVKKTVDIYQRNLN